MQSNCKSELSSLNMELHPGQPEPPKSRWTDRSWLDRQSWELAAGPGDTTTGRRRRPSPQPQVPVLLVKTVTSNHGSHKHRKDQTMHLGARTTRALPRWLGTRLNSDQVTAKIPTVGTEMQYKSFSQSSKQSHNKDPVAGNQGQTR